MVEKASAALSSATEATAEEGFPAAVSATCLVLGYELHAEIGSRLRTGELSVCRAKVQPLNGALEVLQPSAKASEKRRSRNSSDSGG